MEMTADNRGISQRDLYERKCSGTLLSSIDWRRHNLTARYFINPIITDISLVKVRPRQLEWPKFATTK